MGERAFPKVINHKKLSVWTIIGPMSPEKLFGVTSNTYKIRIERIKSFFSAHKDQFDKGFANELEIHLFNNMLYSNSYGLKKAELM